MGILKNKVSIEDGLIGGYCEITESDFYPPADDRMYRSGIDDVFGGDSFEDFAESFWELYEEEIYN